MSHLAQKKIGTIMRRLSILQRVMLAGVLVGGVSSCTPSIEIKKPSSETPSSYDGSTDETNAATVNWREFFKDDNLSNLIDTALAGNQEIKIFMQELEINKNDVTAKSGAYLPFVDLGAGAGFDKVGRYTRNGALEAGNSIAPGKDFPEPLQNYIMGARASWEVDIWHKLRDAEKSAVTRFLATQEGRNFLVTNLIAEVANSYYELRALDNQLQVVKGNAAIQTKALDTVKLEKQNARVTELAVRRFQAQLLKTQSLQYDIQQRIFETENRINFLLGRYPQPIQRDSTEFVNMVPQVVSAGLPSQLLQNRADVRQAELDIKAAELDVGVARAAFYPSLKLSAEAGYEAYRLGKVLQTPESFLYSLTGNLVGPLINRRAITADYLNASAKQVQAVFHYERTLLNAVVEASNQVSNIKNMEASVSLKAKQVETLNSSVDIAGTLFAAARADYGEVLLTQREAIESKFELIETKIRQMQALVGLYRALGGGWQRT